MKFKTRLLITFLIVLIIPLVLTAFAFFGIGGYLLTNYSGYDIRRIDYHMLTDPNHTFVKITNEVFLQVREQIEREPGELEQQEYLEEITRRIENKASYIIVRKGKEIYYTSDSHSAEQIFSRLPEYGIRGAALTDLETGFYYNDIQKLVRQLNFTFSDGSPGSFFIVTGLNYIISRALLLGMFFAIVLILFFTGMMLTGWIQRGVFTPIRQLNYAMQNITEGKFDYMLDTDNRGEIGELYRNYEEMRLRLKETTGEKMETEKQNRELVSNISHDLKTPITAIKGYVEGIMDGVADTPEKMDKYIKTIYNKANDMDRLINELTIYTGIDSNRIPYHFHKIDVADYFGDCIEEVGLDLESKDITLNYANLVSPGTMIIADPEQLKRVVNNIVSNSIKYMDRSKKRCEIDIRILDEIDSIRVEIEDNGRGIAAKDLGKVFERFYRTDASRNSARGGSGIGLSIVKKIIEDHGGYIWATSKEEEGTCMHFVVRKYQDENTEERSSGEKEGAGYEQNIDY